MSFNFEEWAQLARQDQVAFEKKRAAAIQEAIEQSAHSNRQRRRLHGLQFQVDMLRRKHKNALGACIELSSLLLTYYSRLVSLDIEQIRRKSNDRRRQDCQLIHFDPAKRKKVRTTNTP